MNSFRSLSCLAVVSFLFPICCRAEKPLPPLQKGASIKSVIEAWGVPTEKEDHEIKRLEIWRYPRGAFVEIREGHVHAWARSPEDEEVKAAPAVPIDSNPVADQSVNPDTRDLVREIAREVPSGPDVPMPDVPDVPAMNVAPSFVPNPPVQAHPGEVPGLEVIDPDDED